MSTAKDRLRAKAEEIRLTALDASITSLKLAECAAVVRTMAGMMTEEQCEAVLLRHQSGESLTETVGKVIDINTRKAPDLQ